MLSGIASALTTMSGGEAVEVGIVGREGFPEKIHLLGPQYGGAQCFIQLRGEALRMDFKQFQTLFLEVPELQRVGCIATSSTTASCWHNWVLAIVCMMWATAWHVGCSWSSIARATGK